MTFDAELEKTLRAEIETYRDTLAAGLLTEAQYQRVCGSIHAFAAVIGLIPEINKRILER